MDSYIRDMYNQGGQEEPQQSVRPNHNQVPQSTKNIPQLPSNGIQRMQAAAQQARFARQGFGSRPGGVGRDNGRVRRADARSNVLKQWNNQCQIQSITIPQLVSSPSCTKRYRITLTWLDQNGRPHRKDINFGEQGQQQFIDHRDTAIRDARLAKMQEQTIINPLHPNYWKFHMLNKYPDISIAYMKFIQDNELMNRKLVLKKQFRQNSEMSQGPAQQGLNRSQTNRLPTSIANMLPPNGQDEMLLNQLSDYQYSNKY